MPEPSPRFATQPEPAGERPHQPPPHLSRPWTLTVLAALAIIALSFWLRSGHSRLGRWLVQSSYDTSLDFALPFTSPLEDSPVVVVYLDLPSYLQEHQDPGKPWDRALHARLLNRLTQAGARAVVFDILFTNPGPDPQADREFADAIRANGRVVLGTELSASSRATGGAESLRSLTLSLPQDELLDAAAAWGLAYSQVDEDFTARRHFPGYADQGEPSLTWATVECLGLPIRGRDRFLNSPPWIRYYGRPLVAIPHLGYSSALDHAGVSDAFFRNRIVFIGARPMPGGFLERRDELRSPLAGWNDPELFHPGVEIHATQMLNLIRGDWLNRSPPAVELLALTLLGALIPTVLFRLRPVPGTALAFLGSVGTATAAAGSLALFNQWQPWLLVSAVQLPLALLASLLHHSLQWYRDRRRLEAEQRTAERIIRDQAALIDKARDAILVTDLDGNLTYANPGACELYGVSLDALRQAERQDFTFLTSTEAWPIARAQVLNSGDWHGELHQHTCAGTSLILQSRWTLIRDDRGRPHAILMINTDITEKKQIEAQLLRTQRMQTIGSLAGGMAHDLNNALAPVLMGVQLLQRRTPDTDTLRMLQIMENNTQRGADLVRQVLLFARGHQADLQTGPLDGLIHELERLLRETLPPGIALRTLVPDDLWNIRFQPTQLHQVLLNLCVNGRDAMPEGGTLSIAADNVNLSEAEAASIPNARPGNFVMILVADSGCGIPAELQPRVFEPFFTTKAPEQGTGLGLSVVASVLKNHEGFLHLESGPDSGTSIEIYLPEAATETQNLPPSVSPPPPRGQDELVLIVDDEQAIREMLAAVLKEQGYRPLTAASGAEALPLLQQHADSIKLVLLDHLMPLCDGVQLLPAIRSRCPNVPTILASGSATPQPPKGFSHRPTLALLPKPFPLEDLFLTMNRLLHPADSQQGAVTTHSPVSEES